MSTRTNNIKLGVFVIAGLILLVIGLYIIGKNHSLFGSRFELKAHFNNANGIMQGNNVRFSGIQSGTVKKVSIINDTTIEIEFYIEKKIRPYIRKNAQVSVGTEGLMGNKVLDIIPGEGEAPVVEEGDILAARPEMDVTDVLETLYSTNTNIHKISEELLLALTRVNESKPLWDLLRDRSLSDNFKISLSNIKNASERISNASTSLDEIVYGIQNGQGAAGLLLTDTNARETLLDAIVNIRHASDEAGTLIRRLDSLVIGADSSVIGVLLKDTSAAGSINRSLNNIEKGTSSFNENMEALKHNILLRKYFKKKNPKK